VSLHEPLGDDGPAPIDLPNGSDLRPYAFTDLGNAERLVKAYGEDFRYLGDAQKWLYWDGKRFGIDNQQIHLAAQRTARSMSDLGLKLMEKETPTQDFEDDGKDTKTKPKKKEKTYAESLYLHGRKSEESARLKAMVSIATVQPSVWVHPDRLDSEPFMLNVRNGIIDLETNELLPHNRDFLFTHCVDIPHDPTAKCPQWQQFLMEIFDGDLELIKYIWKAVGYSLTASVREEVFFFMHGSGRNGKTTFINILQALLGEYARMTSGDTLMAKKYDGIGNDIAKLKGARLITSPEIEQGKELNESKLKDLTSPGKIQARFMFAEFFEFVPTGKIWMYGNHEPDINGTDDGIWRRMVPIPFNVTIPLEKKDDRLGEKLIAELPGILYWAVRGCVAWQKEGLGKSVAIEEKAREYRESLDVIGQFIQEMLQPEHGRTIQARQMHECYEKWAKVTKSGSMSETAFGKLMKNRKDVRFVKRSGVMTYLDVSIQHEQTIADQRYDLGDH
jgi:putative DNA primase/helicase